MPTLTTNQPIAAIAATAVATAAPSGGTEGIYVAQLGRVRTFLDYTGTVTSCTLKLWIRDIGTSGWFEGPTTDDLDPLTPGDASPVDEARDWDVGNENEVWFQVSAIAGGGTVAVRVQGVKS